MQADVKVELGLQVLRVQQSGGEVQLEFEVRSFGYVLVTAPAPQAAEMLNGSERSRGPRRVVATRCRYAA